MENTIFHSFIISKILLQEMKICILKYNKFQKYLSPFFMRIKNILLAKIMHAMKILLHVHLSVSAIVLRNEEIRKRGNMFYPITF